MTRIAVLRACREIRDACLPAPVYDAGRHLLVDWLRDQLAQYHVVGFSPDWRVAIAEVERVRADWPSSLLGWKPPPGPDLWDLAKEERDGKENDQGA